jgi:inner membrane protein involved in colicin E2 resistance
MFVVFARSCCEEPTYCLQVMIASFCSLACALLIAILLSELESVIKQREEKSKKVKDRQYTYNGPLLRVPVTILQRKSKNEFSVNCWATRHCRQYKILLYNNAFMAN